jgi:hypothetical protein
MIYGPEQGISLATSASNIKNFSLLGETNLIRKTTTGHIPFPDATYGYLILPFLVLLKFDPLPLTFLFGLLNLGTGILLSRLLRKPFGEKVSLFALFFFMLSAPMIHHSLFTWIVNPTPLLSVLTLFFSYKLYKERDNKGYVFLLGLLSGLGFGMQKMYLAYLVLVFLWVAWIYLKKKEGLFVFVLGVALGNIPTIIFDLRHEFYHLKTFTQYFLESAQGKISSPTSYYNYLYLYPVFFTLIAICCVRLLKFSKSLVVLLCLVYFWTNINSPFVDLRESTGMAKNITLPALERASITIAKDLPPEKFNVVTLWDFDTRAHTMRYLLTYRHHLTPSTVENYRQVEVVYALAPDNYDVSKPRVWELQEFLPYKIVVLDSFAEGYKLYKLVK